MEIETILNAHAATYAYLAAADVWTDEGGAWVNPQLYAKRDRQEAAFRARILLICENAEDMDRIVKEKWDAIETISQKDAEIEMYRDKAVQGAEWMTYAIDADQQIAEKDARIAELENKMSGPQINWRS